MNELLAQESLSDFHIFSRSLPLRMKVSEVLRVLGKTEGEDCLVIGADNAAIVHHLSRKGGTWYSMVTSAAAAAAVRPVLGENNVFVLDGDVLPFKKKVFDVVIVMDMLERLSHPESFIMECNRITREDGRLVVSVAKRKPFSMIGSVRRTLGSALEKRGMLYPGYTEKELFNLLKDGFDVHTMRSYCRFFVEVVEACVQSLRHRTESGDPVAGKSLERIYSVAGPFYFLASQMDMLLLFTRGHHLIASAKRRPWRPRKTPVLSDGRSISEAVLSRAPR